MKPDIARNLRLVAATTLVSVWGYSHLAQTPVVGDTIAPLLLALLVAPGSGFDRWRANRSGVAALAVALVALVAITMLLYGAGTEQELVAFAHNPYFVVPVWALALFGLVRNATSAERQPADDERADSHAPSPRLPGVESPVEEAAPGSWSGRKRS